MKTALYLAAILFILSLGIGAAVLVNDVHNGLGDAHLFLAQASATLQKVGTAADTLNASAQEERKNWQKTSAEAAATGRALRLLISRVDRSFVDGTLQHVNTETLPLVDSQIAANGAQFQSTLAKLGNSADGITQATNSLNVRLGDPQIAELLGRVNATAVNLETISANSAAMSGDMKLAVHRLAQPPSKFHQAMDVTWTTLKFGSLFVP